MLPNTFYWTRIINLIIQTYLSGNTICFLWPNEIDLQLEDNQNLMNSSHYSTFIIIEMDALQNSNEKDVMNYAAKRKQLKENNLEHNAFVERLTMAIEKSHCENFFAFQTDILRFIEAFEKSSKYSLWRSTRNKFIFGYEYSKDKMQETQDIFQHDFFDEQAAILVMENCPSQADIFKLKTNHFVGPKNTNRRDLYLLDVYNASSRTFDYGANLFPDKLEDLKGRELIVAALHYRPTVVLEYGPQFKTQDIAIENSAEGKVRVDGTELRTLITFCEVYNCTLQINTAETDDWGFVYTNLTGFGTLGMVAKGTAEVAMGAMYSWIDIYHTLDMSMYLARDGITCVVPAPRRLTSWMLPLEPFQAKIWAAVVVYLIIEIISLFVAHHLERILGVVRNSWWQSFRFGYIITFKLFISQSGIGNVISISVRVLLFACFLNNIIVTSIYGGGLASILTVPYFEEAADSLERLRSQRLKWAGNSEAWVSSILEADDPIMIDILKNFHIYTDEQLAVMALKEHMAFLVERLPFGHYTVETYLTEEALRNKKIMLDDIYFQYTVTFTVRVWPLLERYNNLLYMWHSSGFDKYWEWRVFAENMNMQLQKMVEASMYTLSSGDDLGPVPLDMSNFAGIIIIWVLGIFTAILCFFAELLYVHLTKNQTKNLEREDK